MESQEKITEQNVAALKTELINLKEEIQKIKLQHLSEELQLPSEVLIHTGEIKPVKRMKKGRGSIPLLESEIRDAQNKTTSAADAARYLKVNYTTFKKYSKLYGIWKTSEIYKKEGTITNPEKGKYPVSKLIQGEFPNYPIYRLKDKLIQSGIKKPECEQCGFNERRITDGKMPLLLNFEDGNEKNHKLDNLKLLCYNCSFICGKGYIRRGKKYHVLDDPDRVQGADEYIPKRF